LYSSYILACQLKRFLIIGTLSGIIGDRVVLITLVSQYWLRPGVSKPNLTIFWPCNFMFSWRVEGKSCEC